MSNAGIPLRVTQEISGSLSVLQGYLEAGNKCGRQHHPSRCISLVRLLLLLPYCQMIVMKIDTLLQFLILDKTN